MRSLCFSLAVAAGFASMVAFADDPTLITHKWDDKAFSAAPWKNGDEIGWLIFRNAKGAKGPLVDAEGLLAEFGTEPAHAGVPVLVINSHTYLVPFTLEESRRMPDWVKKQHQDASWKRIESDLFAKLIESCKAQHIRLIVNTSMDMKKPWKILAEP